MAPCTPIIIGIGDIKNRSTAIADAKEPATLMLEAIQAAINDASASSLADLQAAIDSIDVVRTWTWPYSDLPGLLAEKLGVQDTLSWKRYSDHGGDKPGKLFDEAAKRIAKGECKVAIVTGGEALASRAYPYIPRPMRLYTSIAIIAKRKETLSIRMCRSQEAPSTRLDTSLRSCRLSLFAHGPRFRK